MEIIKAERVKIHFVLRDQWICQNKWAKISKKIYEHFFNDKY